MANPFATNLLGQARDDVGTHSNSVGTAELENGSVTAAKLATSFPQGTLGYAQVTADQGAIVAATDLTGLSVTVSVTAGHRIRITLQAASTNTAANSNLIYIQEGATVLQVSRFVNAGSIWTHTASVVLTPSAGSHTYKLVAEPGAGTMTLKAGTTNPAFILVEDITAITASQPIATPTGLWRASADFPAAPAHGDLFYETDTDKLWAWNGTAWVQLIASGAWTDYVPTLTQGVVVSKTVNYARWTRMGRTIHAQWSLSATSTGTAGNAVLVGYPVPAVTQNNRHGAGLGGIYDASVNVNFNAAMILAAAGIAMGPTSDNVGSWLGQAVFTAAVASGDHLAGAVTYEAAA